MRKLYSALLLAFATTIVALPVNAAAPLKDPNTQVSFPATVSVTEGDKTYNLDATGVATRKKFFVKVYSIAHYLQDPTKGSTEEVMSQIFDPDKAKQFTMVWVRTVDTAKIRGAFEEAFQTNLTQNELNTLKPEIDKFLGFFNKDSKKGETYTLRWTPGGVLTVILNNKEAGQITNADFAKAVWNIWFASDSVVPRKNLIDQITQ